MTAYYNELDPFNAEWLRCLIKQRIIAPGIVDQRSIERVEFDEIKEFTQCHFFAGVGVWSYALRTAGWPDWRPVWTASCPCQPFAKAAAEKRKRTADARDLWPVWVKLARQSRINTCFGEQVDDDSAWIDRALFDLENAGFAVGVFDLPACAVDAPTERMRTFFVANRDSARREEQCRPFAMEPQLAPVERCRRRSFYGNHHTPGELGRHRRVKPGLRLLATRTAGRVGKLRGYGNSINGELAAAFIKAAKDVI